MDMFDIADNYHKNKGSVILAKPAEIKVLASKREHETTWTDKSKWFWYLSLLEEVVELGLALLGWHKDPVELELKQISGITMNWLEHEQEGLWK